MQRLIWSLLLVILISNSCQSNTGPTEQKEEKPAVFFALEEFMDTEAERLVAANIKIEKRIQYNGQEEQQLREEINFAQELSIFSRADINKAAWTDLYQADTVFQGAQVREAHYRALDPELEVRSLQIKWTEAGAVSEINILRNSESTLASNEYRLQYIPQEGYRIQTEQQNSTADPMSIKIEGRFITEK